MDPLPPSDELRTKFAVACEEIFIIIAAVDSKAANVTDHFKMHHL